MFVAPTYWCYLCWQHQYQPIGLCLPRGKVYSFGRIFLHVFFMVTDMAPRPPPLPSVKVWTRVSPFRLKKIFAYKRNKANLDPFHYKISLLFFRFFLLISASNFSLRFTWVIFTSKRKINNKNDERVENRILAVSSPSNTRQNQFMLL
jgi:hypothetical protein